MFIQTKTKPLHWRRMGRHLTRSSYSHDTPGAFIHFVASPKCGFHRFSSRLGFSSGTALKPPQRVPVWGLCMLGAVPCGLVFGTGAPCPGDAHGGWRGAGIALRSEQRGGETPHLRAGCAAATRSLGWMVYVQSSYPCASRCKDVSRSNMGSWSQETKEAGVREPGEYLAHPAISRLNICNFYHKKFTSCRSQ